MNAAQVLDYVRSQYLNDPTLNADEYAALMKGVVVPEAALIPEGNWVPIPQALYCPVTFGQEFVPAGLGFEAADTPVKFDAEQNLLFVCAHDHHLVSFTLFTKNPA